MSDQQIFREGKNSGWHSQLVGSRVYRALVSEEDASRRTAALVCAALRTRRGQLEFLFRAGAENGRTLVRRDAG